MRKRIALVTGASRGIRRAIALELTAAFDVVVNGARRSMQCSAASTLGAADSTFS